MKTEIDYLRELEEHLMVVARQEGERAATVVKVPRGAWWRRFRLQLVALGTAGFLVVAGVVGYFATRGSPTTAALTARQELAQLSVIATNDDHKLAFVPATGGPVPSASPAPTDSTGRSTLPSVSSPAGPIVGPSIVKTGELSIRVAKGTFSQQYGKATEIAGRNGGYVATSTVENGKTDSGSVTIRVPADRFEAAVNELRALGRIDRESITGQDVTGRFVDLAARLRNARDQQIVLRRLLAKAPSVAATLRVNNALSNAELQIEELQGQIRALQSRTDLGTIQLTLYERAPQQPKPPQTAGHKTVGGAWRKAVSGFFGVVYSVVAGLGYLVPIMLLIALVALLIWLGVRRARNRVAI